MTPAEQETYGVDWESFQEPATLQSHFQSNDITEDNSSWLAAAEAPPSDQLNEVIVDAPNAALTPAQSSALLLYLGALVDAQDMPTRAILWNHALFYARTYFTAF